jgi:hypothetical protein
VTLGFSYTPTSRKVLLALRDKERKRGEGGRGRRRERRTISHFTVVLFEDIFDLVKPFWRRFRATTGSGGSCEWGTRAEVMR